MSIFSSEKAKFVGIVGAFALAVFLPVFVFGNAEKIYVDEDASGKEDGSKDHPYKTISEALDHATKGSEVHIASGHYKESITIPKGVEVYGKNKDRGKVVIDGGSNKPTVTMKYDSELNHVTVKDGRTGIYVDDDARAKIYDVVVKGAEKDGIRVESASTNKKERVIIDNVVSEKNGKAGLYAKKRDVVILSSEFVKNGTDGAVFAAGVKVWIEKSLFNDNKGSGAIMTADESEIWTKKNQFRRNGREGVELNGYGAIGSIGLRTSKFVENGRYGVAVVARNAAGQNVWKSLTRERNEEWGNKLGGVSKVVIAY
jgi:hypothetical protein